MLRNHQCSLSDSIRVVACASSNTPLDSPASLVPFGTRLTVREILGSAATMRAPSRVILTLDRSSWHHSMATSRTAMPSRRATATTSTSQAKPFSRLCARTARHVAVEVPHGTGAAGRGGASSRFGSHRLVPPTSAGAGEPGVSELGPPDPWETHAGWWQEGFTAGADAEYEEQILPLAASHLEGAARVLDVGAGEGQVARLAAAGGATTVVGVDPTWAQLVVARRRGSGPAYAMAEAAALPFPDGSFEATVACLVFEHIDGVDRAIAEVGRVLRPGGRFLFFLNHPLLQTPGSGWIDDHILEEQYWRIGPYLVEDTTLEEVEKDVFIPFIHRPLSRYVNAMAAAGLVVTRMEEPAPPPGFLARATEYADAATIPRLLFMRAEKRPAQSPARG